MTVCKVFPRVDEFESTGKRLSYGFDALKHLNHTCGHPALVSTASYGALFGEGNLYGCLRFWSDIFRHGATSTQTIGSLVSDSLKLMIVVGNYHVHHVHFTTLRDFNPAFCHVVGLLYPWPVTTEVIEDIPPILLAIGLRAARLIVRLTPPGLMLRL